MNTPDAQSFLKFAIKKLVVKKRRSASVVDTTIVDTERDVHLGKESFSYSVLHPTRVALRASLEIKLYRCCTRTA